MIFPMWMRMIYYGRNRGPLEWRKRIWFRLFDHWNGLFPNIWWALRRPSYSWSRKVW